MLLLLDSDQILNSTAIERCVGLLRNGYEMIILEEHALNTSTWIEQLYEADRLLLQNHLNCHLDPTEGGLLPRMYKKSVLEGAFSNIPRSLLVNVVAHDHAIIYYEASMISTKVGFLENAVLHNEVNSLRTLLRKNFGYGVSTYELTKSGYYRQLLHKHLRNKSLKSPTLALRMICFFF